MAVYKFWHGDNNPLSHYANLIEFVSYKTTFTKYYCWLPFKSYNSDDPLNGETQYRRSGRITHHTDGIHCQLQHCIVDRRHQYTGCAANHTGANTPMWHDEFIPGHCDVILCLCEKRQSHIHRAESRGTSRYKTETVTCQSVTLHSHRAQRTECVAYFDIRNVLYKKHSLCLLINDFFLYLSKPVVRVM